MHGDSECDLLWKSVLCRCNLVKMRPRWVKVALDPIRPVCRHIKDGDTEMYAGRNSHKDGGRYESDLSTSQRMPRIVVSARTERNSSL